MITSNIQYESVYKKQSLDDKQKNKEMILDASRNSLVLTKRL